MSNFGTAAIRASRRQFMTGLGAALAVGSLSPATPAHARSAARTAFGTVFEDTAGRGVRRRRDRGVPGILVSNGRDVATTDEHGRWTLPVRPGDHVFVIKPPRWRTAVDGNGLPRSSYRYQPHGTPLRAGLGAASLAPTGPLPSSIDFPLYRTEERRDFEVLLVADTQPGDRAELGYVREALLAAARTSTAAFAIHHGDVMGDDLGLFPEYLAVLRETGLVWHHAPGNHDLDTAATDPRFALETWKRHIGPPHYAFRYSGATFIVLNNVDYSGSNGHMYGRHRYRGRLGAQQLRFVRNVLAHIPKDELVVLSMHIPLISFNGPESPGESTADRDALLAMLTSRPHTLSLSGHCHTTEHHYLGRHTADPDPHHHHVLTAMCGSWWGGPRDVCGVPVADSCDGSPRGYHVLSIDGSRYETRFQASTRREPLPMRIAATTDSLPERAAEGALQIAALDGYAAPPSRPRLVVDLFDGGPRTRVTCAVAGHEPIEMHRTPLMDPHVVATFAAHPGAWKSWVAPAVSSHIWTATLPERLGPGRHTVLVRAIGEYGREHTVESTIEVAV